MSGMRKKYVMTFWLVTLGFALAYAYIQGKREQSRLDDMIIQGGGEVEELPVLGTVPSFVLQSSDQEKISNESLLGKIWILKLFYADYEYPCMRMSHNFSRLHSYFTKGDYVRLISVSIDPDKDNAEKLNKYREDYHGEKQVWKFLTGDNKVLMSFAEGFRLPLDLEKKTHSTRFVLIDTQGQIRGYYDSLQKSAMELLRSNITQLILQKRAEESTQ